jgi:hypothetical protein
MIITLEGLRNQNETSVRIRGIPAEILTPARLENKTGNVMSSTSSSGKCIGCLDEILSCQSTINSHYTSKLYVQFGVNGIQLWGCASDSNIQVIQRYQKKKY